MLPTTPMPPAACSPPVVVLVVLYAGTLIGIGKFTSLLLNDRALPPPGPLINPVPPICTPGKLAAAVFGCRYMVPVLVDGV